MFSNPKLALRGLKGAPLSIVIALVMAGNKPTEEKRIVAMTGYSGNTVRRGLEFLEEAGLAKRTKRFGGWMLNDGINQLPLPLQLNLVGATGAIEAETTTTRNFCGSSQEIELSTETNLKNCGSNDDKATSLLDRNEDFSLTRARAHVSSSSSTHTQYSIKSIKEEEEGTTKRKNCGSPRVDDQNDTKSKRNFYGSAEQEAVFERLRDAGVGFPMAKKLAQEEWIDIAYVDAHLAKIKQDNEPLRYALQRMKCGDAAPKCDCGVCKDCQERYYKRNGLSDIIQR